MSTNSKQMNKMNKELVEDDNLWAGLLAEVLANSQSRNLTSKSLLVLGDEESGKTTLISRTQSHSKPRVGCGLEYMYIDVKDEYSEEQTHLSVWIVDGHMHYRSFLRFALTEKTFESSAIILVASMDKPWDILDSLQRWAEVVTNHVTRLNIPDDVRKKREDAVYKQFQEYVEPEDGVVPQVRRAATSEESAADMLVPLGDNILTINLGIPIIVVITKSDEMMRLEKDNDYSMQHWDFIQQHIRHFCLKYGAALLYTSGKENKNCSLLYRYLTHRLYAFPFTERACIVEKDCIFVPAGYDNEKKIKILHEGLTFMRPDDSYSDHIRASITRNPIHREVELMEEEEQMFFMKMQSALLKPIDATQVQRTPPKLNTQLSSPKPMPPRTADNANFSPNLMPKKPIDAKVANANDSSVLSSFFNSLLNKKNIDEKPTAKLDSPAGPTAAPVPAAEEVVNHSQGAQEDAAT